MYVNFKDIWALLMLESNFIYISFLNKNCVQKGLKEGCFSAWAKWNNGLSAQECNVHYREKARQLHIFYLSYYTN
jgi:hypothetical protein